MKKATLALLALALLCLPLAGCGGPTAGPEEKENTENTGRTLTVTSDILGLADTGNKTTLKVDLVYTSGPGDIDIYHYDENGQRVIYEDEKNQTIALDPVTYTGSAILDLGDDVDDSLIDCSNAVVRVAEGSGYFADEYILLADRLDGAWENGKYTYTLSAGDLEWNTWGYDASVDYNSTREWSIMGGDGNGVYHLFFEVSGITYDGEEIQPATFPVTVYIYGRTCTDLALTTQFTPNTYDEFYLSGLTRGEEPVWKWQCDNATAMEDGKPYMNDRYTDYFTVAWPQGADASDITADDVTVTLSTPYGQEYTLSTLTPYGEEEYAVASYAGETEIFVTYQQWALYPVYSKLTITVDNGTLSASESFDICSVAAYMVQTGGGGVTVDHTLTCYNYYGITGMTLENAANTGYTLAASLNGQTVYYAEDEAGNSYLTYNQEEAWIGDGTEYYNIAVLGNCVFAETRLDTTEQKLVDGQTITFQQQLGTVYNRAPAIVEAGAELVEGYNLSGAGIVDVAKWPWTTRYQSGWTYATPQPTGLPYVDGSYTYGYEPGGSNPAYDAELAS